MKTWKMYLSLFVFTIIMLTIVRCSKGPLQEKNIDNNRVGYYWSLLKEVF
ncbi:MAG: hypothetical protein J7604_22045 [Sporocytophaga sp.]|nr:hypothetical protein [Sporocytophaga sp.]MBO9702912.1 hypothetical protein [Sporocytophaga sp.]